MAPLEEKAGDSRLGLLVSQAVCNFRNSPHAFLNRLHRVRVRDSEVPLNSESHTGGHDDPCVVEQKFGHLYRVPHATSKKALYIRHYIERAFRRSAFDAFDTVQRRNYPVTTALVFIYHRPDRFLLAGSGFDGGFLSYRVSV